MSVHWGGRGFGHVSRNSYPNSFSPAALFAAGQKGAWFDPSDLSTLFQNSNGTTAVAIGDPVGKILDKSGNGNHMVQATAGLRPTLNTVGGRYALVFDATAYIGKSSAINFSSSADAMMAMQKSGTGMFAFLDQRPTGGIAFLGEMQPSDQHGSPDGSAGTPTYFVNGASVARETGLLGTAVGIDTSTVLEIIGADMSSWPGFSIGQYNFGFNTMHYCFGIVARESLSAAERTATRTWVGAKAGLTL